MQVILNQQSIRFFAPSIYSATFTMTCIFIGIEMCYYAVISFLISLYFYLLSNHLGNLLAYKLAHNPSKINGHSKLCVNQEVSDPDIINPDNPIIHFVIFIISDEEKFKVLEKLLTLKGMKIESLRYLTEADTDHNIKFYQDYLIPILISKSWIIYPFIEMDDY